MVHMSTHLQLYLGQIAPTSLKFNTAVVSLAQSTLHYRHLTVNPLKSSLTVS